MSKNKRESNNSPHQKQIHIGDALGYQSKTIMYSEDHKMNRQERRRWEREKKIQDKLLGNKGE